MGGFTINVMEDAEFRNKILEFTRQQIRPVIEQVVKDALPLSAEKIVARFLEGSDDPSYRSSRKTRVQALLEDIKKSVDAKVAREMISFRDEIMQNWRPYVDQIVVDLVSRKFEQMAGIRELVRTYVRQELAVLGATK